MELYYLSEVIRFEKRSIRILTSLQLLVHVLAHCRTKDLLALIPLFAHQSQPDSLPVATGQYPRFELANETGRGSPGLPHGKIEKVVLALVGPVALSYCQFSFDPNRLLKTCRSTNARLVCVHWEISCLPIEMTAIELTGIAHYQV